MILATVILGLVTTQRLGELALAQRNTRRLLARGAREVGASHYPLIVAMHGLWLVGLWILAWERPVQPVWLALFVLLQVGRVWVLASLGGRWTTRIIVVPGAPLVRRGPYRWVRHPNYWIVAGEILVLPLVFGLAWYGAVFTLLNAAVLSRRIRAEEAALAEALS